MALEKICSLADLVEGEMRDFTIDGREVVIAWAKGGRPRAFDASCPHAGISLAFGEFDGTTIVCGAHQWSFDGHTGEGIYPGNCRLQAYPLRVEGGQVFVELPRGGEGAEAAPSGSDATPEPVA